MCLPKTPEVKDPVAPPTRADRNVQDASDREKRNILGRRGRASTIITGSEGVTSPANTQKKTLLGG